MWYTMTMIPIAKPIIAKNAKKYVLESLASGWVSSRGPFVERFENAFADFVGTKYAVATNSGTSAIHLSVAALNIGPGDEVIVPALTMIAAVLPIIYVGAIPVLVDVEKSTGNIDPLEIEKKLTNKTKAVIVVHLNGHPADMTPIIKLARKYRFSVIEDAAEAHGVEYRLPTGIWKKVASIGDVGCLSLYANKIVTSGEGGMATTSNKLIAQRIRSLQNLSRTPKKHFYHQEIGFTYRMSSLQAALGLAQLEEANRFIDIKRQLASVYAKELSNQDAFLLPVEESYARRIYWNYDIVVKGGAGVRDNLAKYLEKHGVETRTFVIPLHKQPAFLRLGLFREEKYPVAEDLASRGLSLPLGLAMKENEVSFVCRLAKNYFGKTKV